jgi:hypothetical protein
MMECVNMITNEKGQTLRTVDDVREIWSNPEAPYSEFGAKLVGHEVTRCNQTIDGEPANNRRVGQFIRRAQECADKICEKDERALLARLSKKYGKA